MSFSIEDVRAWLTRQAATYLRRPREEIDTSLPMTDYGLTSLTALAISASIEDEYALVLPPETAWDHPSIDELSTVLISLLEKQPRP